MSQPQYIDISHFNTINDWNAYKAWSAAGDGVSRVAIKISEGVDFVDPKQADFVGKAQAAGIGQILFYHYARPDKNSGWSGAQAEVNFFRKTLGDRLRPNDLVMLDYEGYPNVKDSLFPADWAWDWLHLCAGNMNISTDRTLIYSYQAFIQSQLQDSRLLTFPLILARYNATKSPAPVPPTPAPWTQARMIAWQYSDAATVPGVAATVDANVWLGLPVKPPPAPDLDKVRAALLAAQASIEEALNELGA